MSSPTISPRQEVPHLLTMSQQIIALMDDKTNEAPYHVRLRLNSFASEDLRSAILYKADKFLKSLPEEMSVFGTPERNSRRDRQAKWNDILAQPTMLDGMGTRMLKILAVDAWLDFDGVI